MAMSCTLVRSVFYDGWLSPSNTPVVVLGVTSEGKARCRVNAAVGPKGEVRNDIVVEVLPEDLMFQAIYPHAKER